MLFLYKIKNTDDRDCCAYIRNQPQRFECNHYFGGVNLEGACYSNNKFADYEDIKTILTKEEYQQLIDFAKAISELGYGIARGDDRYNLGVELCKGIQPIYDKLASDEAQKFFNEIWEEEKEFLYDEYSLDDDDCEYIAGNYALDYRDRSIVGYVYNDAYDCGYEEAFSLGIISNDNDITSRYFDFEEFGSDLANDENYCELPDGRIASLCY